MLALNYVKKNLRAGGFAQAGLAYLADCMNESAFLHAKRLLSISHLKMTHAL